MSRYDNIKTTTKDNKRLYVRVKYPEIKPLPSDLYIICNSTDRYDKLAHDYYGDSSLWWIIAIANGASPQDTIFPPLGVYVRIPQNYVEVQADFNNLNKN